MKHIRRRWGAWVSVGGVSSALIGAGACGDSSSGERNSPDPGPDDSRLTDISPTRPAPQVPAPLQPIREEMSGEEPEATPPPMPPPEPAGTRSSPLAGKCARDSDCVEGLGCATVLGQSAMALHMVGGGYCSIPCSDDAGCASLAGGSICYKGLAGAAVGFCTASCEASAPEEEKCGGRQDLRCEGIAGTPGFCSPSCASDADCGFDECDAGNGQCRRGLPEATTPVGGLCPPDQPVTCSGYCVREEGQPGVCSGPCRLGSICDNDAANVCVPTETAERRGDRGECERGCQTSADCVPGLTACAPTGFSTASGEPQRSCAQVPSGESLLSQRLSVEELALPAIPPNVLAVQSFSAGDTYYKLAASAAGVCVTGTRDAVGSPTVVTFQLGTNDPLPFDASAFDSFVINYTGDASVRLEAQLASSPGSYYRNYIAPGFTFPLGQGQQRVPFSEMAGTEATDPPWDPAQLEAVRFVIGADGAPGPFEVCVTELGFE